jgi:hypothetical protein
MKIRPVKAKLFQVERRSGGRTGRHDEVNSHLKTFRKNGDTLALKAEGTQIASDSLN